jgi:3-oxoacyl-(acyl-carrier-protein) synthase
MSDIAITAYAAASAAGSSPASVAATFRSGRHALRYDPTLAGWVGRLPDSAEAELAALVAGTRAYARLDRTTQLAMWCSERAVRSLGWDADFGIQFGSSRGATQRWEAAYAEFLATGRVPPTTSPLTTLGNISSWVGQHLGSRGYRGDHSVTCSTALHAIATAVAWLRAGLFPRFLAGAAEAPLTPFGLAQLRALRIYSDAPPTAAWPCQPLTTKRRSTLVLGEGVACFALERHPAQPPLAWIRGLGWYQESIDSPTGIDAAGSGFYAAMEQALAGTAAAPDLIIAHAPGTRRGDAAELAAIRRYFGADHPPVVSTKYCQGHTFGASGGLSLELALLYLQGRLRNPLPFSAGHGPVGPVRRVLINSAGFGGNGVSILLGDKND